jgi:hypothetical protein
MRESEMPPADRIGRWLAGPLRRFRIARRRKAVREIRKSIGSSLLREAQITDAALERIVYSNNLAFLESGAESAQR